MVVAGQVGAAMGQQAQHLGLHIPPVFPGLGLRPFQGDRDLPQQANGAGVVRIAPGKHVRGTVQASEAAIQFVQGGVIAEHHRNPRLGAAKVIQERLQRGNQRRFAQ